MDAVPIWTHGVTTQHVSWLHVNLAPAVHAGSDTVASREAATIGRIQCGAELLGRSM